MNNEGHSGQDFQAMVWALDVCPVSVDMDTLNLISANPLRIHYPEDEMQDARTIIKIDTKELEPVEGHDWPQSRVYKRYDAQLADLRSLIAEAQRA